MAKARTKFRAVFYGWSRGGCQCCDKDYSGKTRGGYPVLSNTGQCARKRFDWLSSGDITVKEKLCNHFRQLEWQLVITKLNLELPFLQRQMRDYGAQTTSAYTKLQINRHSDEIWIDQRLGNNFREGYPEPPERPSIFAKLVSCFSLIFFLNQMALLWRLLQQKA